MAASVLALAVALLLGASSRVDHGAAAAPVSEEGLQVTYGSTVKLMHEKTKVRLHSHDVAYGSGSGQQSVTGFPEIDDSNSYWVGCLSVSHGFISRNCPHLPSSCQTMVLN
uniref:Predicted protein n=1 Tax=Hordeum vulgare subsp. vulgare TaxID=112509 RepID=F2DMT9_HORVV|nr:predicted protein [Hordeum vulgare subsp. vulgare]